MINKEIINKELLLKLQKKSIIIILRKLFKAFAK